MSIDALPRCRPEHLGTKRSSAYHRTAFGAYWKSGTRVYVLESKAYST